MGEVQSHTRPSYFFQNSYLRKQSSNCKKSSLKNVSVLVLVCCGAGAVGSSGFGAVGWWYVRTFVCVLSEGKFFPVVGKFFSCWKEKFFLSFDQKVLNFRKFEWFTDGQLENFFLSDGKIFPVGKKFFSCRKEGLGMPEGFDKTIYLIELPEPSLVSSLKNKWFIYSTCLKLSKYSVIFSFNNGKSSLNVSIVQPLIS